MFANFSTMSTTFSLFSSFLAPFLFRSFRSFAFWALALFIFSLATLVNVVFVFHAISNNKTKATIFHLTTYIPMLKLISMNQCKRVEHKWNTETGTCNEIKQNSTTHQIPVVQLGAQLFLEAFLALRDAIFALAPF